MNATSRLAALLRPGEVACLRTCDAAGRAHGGFRWPLVVGAEVAAPDWSAEVKCGNGLHGLRRGVGDGQLLDWNDDATWLIVAAVESECVDLSGKVKFPRARVLHVGDRYSCAALLTEHYPGEAVTAGTATAGYRGMATAGYRGTATAGDRGTATAGYRGTVLVRWWSRSVDRYRIATGYVGEDGIEPGVPYCVREGKLVRADDGGRQ